MSESQFKPFSSQSTSSPVSQSSQSTSTPVRYPVLAQPSAPICSTRGKAEMPTSQVELSIACRHLINADTFSKSDPMVIVYERNDWQDKYYEIGRTEMISDNLNPDFVKRFQLSYNFETVQRLKFEVWDIDPVIKLGKYSSKLMTYIALNYLHQF
jgi:hypothetical protein